MRHSLEPEYRKYVKGYGFLSFARKFGDKYGKKLVDTATSTGKTFAKTAGKRVVHKTAEATGDLVGNKIADKITSIGKPKRTKKEEDEDNIMEETQEIFIPPEKRKQIIKKLKSYFKKLKYKMEFNKINNFLGDSSDKVPRFVTKKWIKIHPQSTCDFKTSKEIKFKTSMLRSDLRDYSEAYVWVKGDVTLIMQQITIILTKSLLLKIMLRLYHVFQKLTVN